MLEYDIKNFNSQKDMPETSSKLDSIAKRLDNVEMFLKHEYVLQKKAIVRETVGNLYAKYKSFCSESSSKPKSKIDFNKQMSEMNFEFYKSNDKNVYNVSLDDLNALAKKRRWIHELDEYVGDDTSNKSQFILTEDKNVITLQNENELLKKKIAELELLLKQKSEVTQVDEDSDEEVVEIDNEEEIEPDLPSYTKPIKHDENLANLFSQLI
jgi:hypothetical protein